MEGISGSDTLPHIPITSYKLRFEQRLTFGDGRKCARVDTIITLIRDKSPMDPEKVLALLLNSPNVNLSSSSELKPCFDLSEMERRNQVAKLAFATQP